MAAAASSPCGARAEQADAPADAVAVDGAQVPELERQRQAGLGQQLVGERRLRGGAGVAGAELAAALGAAGQEHAGRAQAGRLDDVQGAHPAQAGQLDQAHVVGVGVVAQAAQG